ncbi:hypothetical protein CapIbe_021660 [Capra ibex]
MVAGNRVCWTREEAKDARESWAPGREATFGRRSVRAAVGDTTEAKNDASDILPSLVSEELTTEQGITSLARGPGGFGVESSAPGWRRRQGSVNLLLPPDSAFRSAFVPRGAALQGSRLRPPGPPLLSPARLRRRPPPPKSTASIPSRCVRAPGPQA